MVQIETIAGKCPLLDGNAVFFARALLSTVKDTIFDDGAICDAAQNRNFDDEKENEKSSISNRVKLYPNPAKEEVILEFDTVINNPMQVRFYTITGEDVKVLKIPAGAKEFKVDLANYSSGIYFCRVFGGKQEMNVEKLIILK